MTIKECLKQASQKLSNSGIASARLDAELLLCEILKHDRTWLLAHDSHQLDKASLKRFDELLARRLKRIPMSYILARKQFYGLDFFVDERVLTPRDETETIAQAVIERAPKHSKVIDIGTGSGALAVTIKYHRPDLIVSASEVSADALAVATINAKAILGQNHDIQLIESNLFDNIVGQFDFIVTNLPYVSTDYKPRMMREVQYEPNVAIFGGEGDGLDLYRSFFSQVRKHLTQFGRIYLESDPWQQPELIKIAQKHGLEKILQDYLSLGFALRTS